MTHCLFGSVLVRLILRTVEFRSISCLMPGDPPWYLSYLGHYQCTGTLRLLGLLVPSVPTHTDCAAALRKALNMVNSIAPAISVAAGVASVPVQRYLLSR